jgi:hypothetical protein
VDDLCIHQRAAASSITRLPLPDSSGDGAERRRVADHVDARGLLLDASSGSAGVDPAVTAYVLAAARP